MAKITTKGISPPIEDREMWFKVIADNFPYLRVYSESLNPTAVGANSEDTQTFTITGLSTNDVVFMNPPALDTGIGIMYYRVSAADTLQIRFRNFTGGSINPAAGTYNIVAIRK